MGIALARIMDYIVPTPVGVNRIHAHGVLNTGNCPHARGGEPLYRIVTVFGDLLSPRPWG